MCQIVRKGKGFRLLESEIRPIRTSAKPTVRGADLEWPIEPSAAQNPRPLVVVLSRAMYMSAVM